MTAPAISRLAHREQAFAAAAQVLADALADVAEVYAAGGPIAVAEAAWLPGGPSREELAAHASWLFGGTEQMARAS